MKKINLLFLIFYIISCIPSYAATTTNANDDYYYMQVAILLAKQNLKAPFGAVIVDNKTGKIIGAGVNAVRSNPTYHGEMVAINDCAQKHPQVDWANTTLYTTAEPCSMCQSAIIWTGISRMVFATSIDYLKSHGWQQIDLSATEVNKKAPFYKGTITGGILAEETNKLFIRK